MTTTAKHVEDACASLQRHLDAFAADATRTADLQRCLDLVQWLRQEYRQNSALLAPHMDRVKQLSQAVKTALSQARQSLVSQYLQAAGAVYAWERIRDNCRSLLLELATAENAQRLECPNGYVEIVRGCALTLPKAGTRQREQLCALISQAGCWPEVAYPNPVRLLKAMDEGRFGSQAAQVAQLCPARTTCRLQAHGDGQTPAL